MLARSFRRLHPQIPFVVLIADSMPDSADREPFFALELAAVAIAGDLTFRAREPELSYLATPYLLRWLLDAGVRRTLFLKQETEVRSSARRIFDELQDCSILLGPHLPKPAAGADATEQERTVLNVGAYNVGVLGIAADTTASAFVDWWMARVTHDSALAIERGVHYEQRWLTLVPTLFERVLVDRNLGTNLGHWRLPDDGIHMRGSAPHVDDQPVVAMRYSGYDAAEPRRITRYGDRLEQLDLGVLRDEFERYGRALVDAGHEDRAADYAYGAYDDGVPIQDRHRELFAGLLPQARERFADPFRTGPGSFRAWVDEVTP